MAFIDFVKKFEPDKEKRPFLHTVYDGFFTFLYTPNEVTKGGVHIRDGIDLKRTMVYVVLALQLCYVFGTWNIGHQHFLALGVHEGYFDAFHLKIGYGLTKILPLFIWTHLVGLGIEFYYAYRKGHGIEEGFLVSGALIPLIMPPDLPIWILCLCSCIRRDHWQGGVWWNGNEYLEHRPFSQGICVLRLPDNDFGR